MNAHTKDINGIRYTIMVDDVPYFQSHLLWKAIQGIPVGELKDGFKIEIGFSEFTLLKCEIGYRVVAPDYESTPFSGITEDLTLAFLIQMEQLELLQKYHISGETIRFDEEIAIARDCMDKSNVCMQRFRDLGGSGWCVNEALHNEDGKFSNVKASEYESIYAYKLLKLRPSLLKVLMLPYDYVTVFDGEDIVEILNEKDESVMTDMA